MIHGQKNIKLNLLDVFRLYYPVPSYCI